MKETALLKQMRLGSLLLNSSVTDGDGDESSPVVVPVSVEVHWGPH